MTAHKSPPLFLLLLKRTEAVLSRWIRDSTAAREELRALEGRSMIIDIENTSWRIALRVDQQQLRFHAVDEDSAADIVIRAGLFDLVAMLRAQSLSQLGAGEVDFRGSLRIAEAFSRLLRLARPRLEDELAGWVGGMPASVLARTGDAAFTWGAKTADSLERNAAEYLQAETGELPRQLEVADFLIEVETLRDDVDRIAQRIAALTRRVSRMDSA